jgi:hypothetical protein
VATPTNGSYRSRSVSTPLPALTELNWLRLSVQSTAILRTVLIPLSQGYSTTQVAKEIGISPSSVSCLVAYFENELEQLPRNE